MAYSAKRAQQAQEESKKMIEEAVNSIKNYTKTPEDLKELADFMAQFPQYSTKNQLLIEKQYSGATVTAGYKQFEALGYHVRKGEKAIRILAPKKREYIIPEDGQPWIPKEKWTKEQKNQVKNDEVKTYSQLWFKRVPVFDISQTDMPIEEAPKLLPNRLHSFDMTNVENESKLYQALVNVAESKGVSVQVASTGSASKGYAYQDQQGKVGIVLSNRLDLTNRIPTLIHEMTHAFIHFDSSHQELTRGQKEFQAEFSSYITSKAFGIDTSEKAIPYMAEWTDRLNKLSNEDLVDLLEDTQKVSRNIIRLTNNEWEQLAEQNNQQELSQQDDAVHHNETIVYQQDINREGMLKETQPNSRREAVISSTEVVLAGVTTLEMVKKAQQEASSRLSFKINGHEYLLSTERSTGDSRLIDRGEVGIIHQDMPQKVVGQEKYTILQSIEDAGYLPMSVEDYHQMDALKEKHLYPSHQTYDFLKETSSKERDKFNRLNSDYDSNTGILNQPFISIEWSEYDDLKTGQILTLEEAIERFNQLNQEYLDEGYSKTKINLHLTPNEYYDTKIYSGKEEADFKAQLKADYPHQMSEIELAQLKKETKELAYDDPDEWESLKVNTEFKGHQFQYDIQVNRIDYQVKGTYQRDQEAPKEATEKSCLNAIQYMLNNHEMDEQMVHTLNKAIEEAQNRQERIQLYQENQQRIDMIESQSSSHESKQSNKLKPMRFDEKIKMARQVDILAVAEAYGMHLTKDSRDQYRDADNHSMVFTPSKNTFYENNGNFGGDPITFAQKVMGIDSFKEAVNYLVNGDYGKVDITNQEKQPFQYDASKEVKHFDKARNYLVNERCIHPDLVDALHEKGYIRQDKRNNVLFLWNEKGRIVGCAEQGTVKMKQPINGRDHWKAIQKNSESYNGYAFNFSNGEPKHLKFFESDIDALSYASIHGLEKDTQYVAMDGLKDNVVAHYAQEAMQKTHHHVESIQLCVDNDEAGRKFAEKYDYLKQEGQPIKVELNVPEIPTELNNQTEKWDWNNECQYRHYQNQPSIFQTLEEFGIQPQLLQFLKEKKFVTENWKHELTFNWNENGEKVGETVCDSRLQVIERTEGTQGFNLQNGQMKTLKCFEGPIEMMSYLSLHSLEENTSYVSLDGQNRSIIDHYVSQNPTIQHVEICVTDKDKANQLASEIYPSLKGSTIQLSTTTCETSFLSKCQRHCEAQSTITQDGGDLEQ